MSKATVNLTCTGIYGVQCDHSLVVMKCYQPPWGMCVHCQRDDGIHFWLANAETTTLASLPDMVALVWNSRANYINVIYLGLTPHQMS